MTTRFTRPLRALRKTLAAGRPSLAGLFSPNRRSGGRHVLGFEALESRHLLSGDGLGVLPDPLVSIPDDLQGLPGQVVTAPVNIDDADAVRAAEIYIQYDTALLDADNGGVRPGSVWPETNTSLFPKVDDAAGTVEVWVFGIEPLGPGAGSLVEIDFTIAEDVCEGQPDPTIETQLILTQVILSGVSEGDIPAQTSDGLITVLCNVNPPQANPDAITLDEGTSTTVLVGGATRVLDNDTDPDLPNDSLVVAAVNGEPADVGQPVSLSAGTLTLQADGSFSYEHGGTESFADSFEYEIHDEAGHSSTTTVEITITPVNDNPPVAVSDSITVAEGDTATLLDSGATSVLDNDSDADLPGDTLSAVLDTEPSFADSFTLNPDGTFSYAHDGSENFSDSFTYHVNDGTNDSNTVTVSLSITPVNDNPPVAVGDSITVAEGDTATLLDGGAASVLDNDSDADLPGDTLSAVLDTEPSFADSFTLNPDGTFSYAHDGSENFSDSFTYHANDGVNDGNTVIVAISITPSNDNSPVAVADSITVAEGGTATLLESGAASVLDNDTDADLPSDLLSTVLDTGPSFADIFTLNPNGTFSYTHNGTENFSDGFTYHVNDGTNDSNTVTVSISITPVNDSLPVAVSDSITVAEGDTATLLDSGATSVLGNDSDADLPGDTLSAVLDTGPSFADSFTLNPDGTFSYTHHGTEDFSDSFTYYVNDGVNDSNTVTVSISVTPINDAPILELPPRQATAVNTPLVFSQVGGNPIRVDDVDAGDGELEVTLDATNGLLSLDGTVGLDFTDGDGTDDPSITFTGTLAAINAALDGMAFSPTEGFERTATVAITVDDQGHSGAGEGRQASGQIQIDVGRNGTVSGFVYADTNRNGRPDEHEGVPGVLLAITGEHVSLETWTDDHGWYEFREVLGGTYTIVERQPECMIDGGGNTLTGVVVAAAQSTVGQNFREVGLKPEYVFNRFYATSSMAIGSNQWREVCKTVVEQGEEDAGRSPSSPPVVTQQILQQGSEVVVRGTNGDDDFAFVAADTGGGQHEVKLNGETHHFDAFVVSSIVFDGGLGVDTATLIGSTAPDQLDAVAKSASLRGAGYLAEVVRTEKTTTNAGTGAVQDKAALVDSIADDVLRAESDSASLAAFYYEHVLREFDEITATSSHGGQDRKAVDEAIDYLLTADAPWIDL